MAATPEDAFLVDPEPFSPSVFLDLPPTPHHSQGPDSDDMDALRYISRMLMEEDIDDKFFYLYPDHPALLTAQQPYAQILSDAAGNENPSFVSAGQNGGATGIQKISSAFSNGKDDEANTVVNVTALPAGGDSEQRALAAAFINGQTDCNMEVLNEAFLEGMEEASKFLPPNSALAVDLEAASDKFFPWNSKTTAGALAAGHGSGRKNKHDDLELEAEAGRRSKVMMPAQSLGEEAGAGEIMDELMLRQYEMCVKGMQELRVAMSREDEINCRKAARGRRVVAAPAVVDLRAMLISCAQAVAAGDRRGAAELLKQIRRHSSPRGDAMQRVAACFAEGLEARLAGKGSEVYRSLMAQRISTVDFLEHHRLFMAATPVKKVKFTFANKTIMDAVAGRRRLHIVDYGVLYGFQWAGLLRQLAARDGGPPEVRITGIDFPQPGFRPSSLVDDTGRRLRACAREFGVPFEYRGVAARWETVRGEDLSIHPDEVLVVNCQSDLGKLDDDDGGGGGASPRDAVLRNIRAMRPVVFVQWVANGTYGGAPFFPTRFREALAYYSAYFDALDATIPRDNDVRLLIERVLLGRAALNVVACEGGDRVDRPETYRQWAVRNHRAGFRQLPLQPEVVKTVREKVRSYHREFLVDVDGRWLLQGWKGRVLYATAAWVADDAAIALEESDTWRRSPSATARARLRRT